MVIVYGKKLWYECRIHKGSSIIPILSRINLIPHIGTNFFKMCSDIVFPKYDHIQCNYKDLENKWEEDLNLLHNLIKKAPVNQSWCCSSGLFKVLPLFLIVLSFLIPSNWFASFLKASFHQFLGLSWNLLPSKFEFIFYFLISPGPL